MHIRREQNVILQSARVYSCVFCYIRIGPWLCYNLHCNKGIEYDRTETCIYDSEPHPHICDGRWHIVAHYRFIDGVDASIPFPYRMVCGKPLIVFGGTCFWTDCPLPKVQTN